MSTRYLGRLQLTKVQSNQQVFNTYKEFKQHLIPPVKYRTIYITLSRNEE